MEFHNESTQIRPQLTARELMENGVVIKVK